MGRGAGHGRHIGTKPPAPLGSLALKAMTQGSETGSPVLEVAEASVGEGMRETAGVKWERVWRCLLRPGAVPGLATMKRF